MRKVFQGIGNWASHFKTTTSAIHENVVNGLFCLYPRWYSIAVIYFYGSVNSPHFANKWGLK